MYITYIIIAITSGVSLYALKNQDLLAKLLMNPYVAQKRNEYHRFITSGFVHLDHAHLIFNMISLYFFGVAVEVVFGAYFGELGNVYFILLYLLGIIASDIPSYLKNKNNPRYNSLGASGGVAAVIFAFIIFRPLDDIYLYFAMPVPGFILGTLYIIFSWYQGRKSNDNINHDAHLYGALFGLLFCIVIYPASVVNFFDQIRNWKVFS
ncbi:MAG TPA: rhomboid family intramembrane serine protease [Chryseosolibacter sp.]|nr:rhomboid family intramembrane serine protease [Chryseosolibacter sp.]